jgi:hypothetical protein
LTVGLTFNTKGNANYSLHCATVRMLYSWSYFLFKQFSVILNILRDSIRICYVLLPKLFRENAEGLHFDTAMYNAGTYNYDLHFIFSCRTGFTYVMNLLTAA